MTQFKRIAAEDAKAYFDEQTACFVDIRDEASFAQGHIPKSQHLDNQGVPDFIAEGDKSLPLIVCCYHGNSSQPAAQFFANQGFSEVYSLDGGFEYWRQLFPEACASDVG